jgi:voltage-gated potassium channel
VSGSFFDVRHSYCFRRNTLTCRMFRIAALASMNRRHRAFFLSIQDRVLSTCTSLSRRLAGQQRSEPMAFVRQVGAAVVLVTLTLSLQSAGMATFIHWTRAYFARAIYRIGLLHSAVLLVRFTTVIFVLHMAQILLWAGFYRWNCFPSWQSAFYFSTTSYSTVGYGDLVLPRMWQTLGPVESVTGVLMCGLSVSLLFAIVALLVHREEQAEAAKPGAERA